MDSAVAEKVCAIREKVADRIGANRFRTWFGESTGFRLDGQQLDVTVANTFVGNWISNNYMVHLIDAVREVVGAEPRVAVRVGTSEISLDPGTAPAAHCPAPAILPPARVRTRPERPTLRGELASFVVGPSNELAYSVSLALASAPGSAFKHLVVHGGCGLGKTHLLQGVCNELDRRHGDREWRYLSGEEFTNEFIYAVKSGHVDSFRARFRNVDVLVIDDIHFLANKKATQEEFLHTFNAIDASGKTVVLSSDCHPRSIATLSAPLVNRLMAAMIVEITPPDYATRREILRRRAATMQCELPADVLDFLAQRLQRNVRELEGALYKLAAFSALTREPLTVDLARRTVEDYITAGQPPAATHIERVAAAHFGVTVEALHSASRDRTVTAARAVAVFLIRKHTRMSFPEIGRFMGNKQHSTILMAVRRVQDALDQQGQLTWKTPAGLREVPAREVLDALEQRLVQRGEPQA